MAIKKAKTLSADQFSGLLEHVKFTRHAERDTVMLLLSFKCGLRACEIARLRWLDVTDAKGAVLPVGSPIELGHHITKGNKPDTKVYMHPQLRDALQALWNSRRFSLHDELMHACRRDLRSMSVNNVTVYLFRLYAKAGLVGCSSHTGRRSFITELSRVCNKFDSSIKDVQNLARHSDIRTTEKYIDISNSAKNLALNI